MSNCDTNSEAKAANDDSKTTTSAPEYDYSNYNTNVNSGCSEALASGISTMLGAVIRDFDSKAEDASRSQSHLSSALDRLTSELDQLLEDAPLPFIIQHAAKLSNVRKRVSSLNTLLRSVQHRLDNIDRMMSIGSNDTNQRVRLSQDTRTSNMGDSK